MDPTRLVQIAEVQVVGSMDFCQPPLCLTKGKQLV